MARPDQQGYVLIKEIIRLQSEIYEFMRIWSDEQVRLDAMMILDQAKMQKHNKDFVGNLIKSEESKELINKYLLMTSVLFSNIGKPLEKIRTGHFMNDCRGVVVAYEEGLSDADVMHLKATSLNIISNCKNAVSEFDNYIVHVSMLDERKVISYLQNPDRDFPRNLAWKIENFIHDKHALRSSLVSLQQHIDKILELNDLSETTYGKYRRNIIFSINPHQFNSSLTGKINVRISTFPHLNKNDFDSQRVATVARIMANSSHRDDLAKNLRIVFTEALGIILQKPHFFASVYGRKVSFNLFIDYDFFDEVTLGAAAFVRTNSSKIFKTIKTKDLKYKDIAFFEGVDGGLKNMRIVFNAEQMRNMNAYALSTILVHELTHLFDRVVGYSTVLQQIRVEGIARFAESIHTHYVATHIPQAYHFATHEQFMENFRANSSLKYEVGNQMCWTIFQYLLKQRGNKLKFGPNQFNAMIKEREEYAETAIKLMKRMKDKFFLDYYIKACKNTGLVPFLPEAELEKIRNLAV